ncbi:DotI/IcmL/TraM family protein [Vibrio fluvialis]|nr:DotI/IcmL/TraM family protein [Vibrio fluvialis]MBY7902416.1 DotI/IcmL/TraM family protein [Vibrio fluvialis]
MDNDPAQQAILDYIHFLRKEVVRWFCIALLLIALIIYSLVQLKSVTSQDVNRSYVGIDRSGREMQPDYTDLPHSTKSDSEVMQWAISKLKYCMTFDYVNYASISNQCNAGIFSLQSSPDPDLSYGQFFYSALEKADLIKNMIDNQTSMTIEYIHTEQSEKPKKVKGIYSYFFKFTFRVQMQGQILDAPIQYDVTVQRMANVIREDGLGIQSVISTK